MMVASTCRFTLLNPWLATSWASSHLLAPSAATNVIAAQETLRFTNRAVAEVVEKTLNSAVANAAQKGAANPENLVVKACFADEGPTLKRIRPRAKGSAARIRKRTSHITVIVATREEA